MKTAKTVAAYLAALPPDQRKVLTKLRADIMAAEPKLEETISYGMPTFKLGPGYGIVGFAAFKAHCSLFPMSATIAKELGLRVSGKSTLQFTPEEPLSAALVKRIVKHRVAEDKALRAERAARKAAKKRSATPRKKTKTSTVRKSSRK